MKTLFITLSLFLNCRSFGYFFIHNLEADKIGIKRHV